MPASTRSRPARDTVIVHQVALEPDDQDGAWVEAHSPNGCVQLRWRTLASSAPRVGARLELAIKEIPDA